MLRHRTLITRHAAHAIRRTTRQAPLAHRRALCSSAGDIPWLSGASDAVRDDYDAIIVLAGAPSNQPEPSSGLCEQYALALQSSACIRFPSGVCNRVTIDTPPSHALRTKRSPVIHLNGEEGQRDTAHRRILQAISQMTYACISGSVEP